jgi:cellulose synthase/poly-beta-1,6-N-acetylglucosamine synthase-like glycosyltransferase
MEWILYVTRIVWILISIKVTVFSALSAVYRHHQSATKAQNVRFVVTTIASSRIKDSLEEVLSKLDSFRVATYVVIDEGSDLTEWLAEKNIKLVIVPKDYTTEAIAKGRAMDYFVKNHVQDKDWYVFFDDDSYPLDDKFLYEIPYYEKLGYAGGNGNLVPRQGKSVYTYILDNYRFMDDIIYFRATQGTLHHPSIGFHGEGLILKGSVLKEIGFGFNSITEDFRFAMELCKKGYRTWHSSTRVSTKSTNSMKDFVRQRARWFKGIAQDAKHAHFSYFLMLPFHLGLSCVAFFGSFPFLILAIIYPIPFFILSPAGTAYWILSAFILPRASLKDKFLTMLISPVESIVPLYAIKMKSGFYVVDKSN